MVIVLKAVTSVVRVNKFESDKYHYHKTDLCIINTVFARFFKKKNIYMYSMKQRIHVYTCLHTNYVLRHRSWSFLHFFYEIAFI